MSFPYLAVSDEATAPAAPLVRVNQKVLRVAHEAASRKLWWLGMPIEGECALPPLPPANVVFVRQHPHSDLAMGLTEFTEGKASEEEDGGAGWLAVQLALCAGRPPVLDDCVHWVFEHEARWREIVADPLASDYWQNVPKPWQCLAAIFEWIALLDAGHGFVSHLPVSVNAAALPVKGNGEPRREVRIDEAMGELLAYAAVATIQDGWTVIGVGPGVFATHARDAPKLAWWLKGGLEFADREEGADMQQTPKYKTAIAWAVPSVQPAREGSLGFYACGWAISYDGGKTWPLDGVSVSEQPDGDSWSAGIIATRKVLEAVDPHTSLRINVRNKTLADCYVAGWQDGRGKPQAGADVAQPIFDLKASKRLTSLTIQQAPADKMATSLLKRAKAAAKERDAALTSAERRAVPGAPGAQPKNQTGGFPPIDETGNDLP